VCVRARAGARVRVCARVCTCVRVCTCAGRCARVRAGASNPLKKKFALRVACLQRVPYHSCALPMARQFKLNFTAMKKHVYILHTANKSYPTETAFKQVFASAEDLLSYLIKQGRLHGARYPRECMQAIADSVNNSDWLPNMVTNFFAGGGVELPKDSFSHHVPYLVMKRPIETCEGFEVNIETIAEVSK